MSTRAQAFIVPDLLSKLVKNVEKISFKEIEKIPNLMILECSGDGDEFGDRIKKIILDSDEIQYRMSTCQTGQVATWISYELCNNLLECGKIIKHGVERTKNPYYGGYSTLGSSIVDDFSYYYVVDKKGIISYNSELEMIGSIEIIR